MSRVELWNTTFNTVALLDVPAGPGVTAGMLLAPGDHLDYSTTGYLSIEEIMEWAGQHPELELRYFPDLPLSPGELLTEKIRLLGIQELLLGW